MKRTIPSPIDRNNQVTVTPDSRGVKITVDSMADDKSYVNFMRTQATVVTPDQQQFYETLNPDAQVMFMRLTSEQRDLAINVYNAPPGHNLCAGLNACSEPASTCHSVNGCHTPGNSCMGHGPGPNTSHKRFTNPNDAVRVVYNKMAAQRNAMQ